MQILEEIRHWLDYTIIELNLCPFASLPYKNNQVRFSLVNESDNEKISSKFIKELELLNSEKQIIETTLFVLPNMSLDFRAFNDFVGMLEDSLFEVNLHDEFQIVGFHPRFVFNGLESSDRANWVNRSPHPLIHILKTSSIAKLKLNPNEGEQVSFNNEKKLNDLNENELKKYFWYIKEENI